MISLEDIKNLTTAQLNSMTHEQVKTYLQRASSIAKNRRSNAIKKMEEFGVEAGIYAKQPKGHQNMSYRYTDFNYDPTEPRGKMVHKLRTIQRFLNDKTSTWTGIKETYSNFTNYLTAISGKNGDFVKAELARIDREGSREGLSDSQIKRRKNAYLKMEADRAMNIRDAAIKANKFDKKRQVRKFWGVYNRIRETFKKEVYDSDSVKQLIYDELTKDARIGVDKLVKRVSEKLRGEYEREETDWSRGADFDSFFEYDE